MNFDEIRDEALMLRDEAKSAERRARLMKRMAARLLDNIQRQSQSKEDTDGRQQDTVEEE